MIINYNDDTLNYRLIPASRDGDKNIAVVIAGNYSGSISVPERFTYTTPDGNPERYYVEGVAYKAFTKSSISSISFNSKIAAA